MYTATHAWSKCGCALTRLICGTSRAYVYFFEIKLSTVPVHEWMHARNVRLCGLSYGCWMMTLDVDNLSSLTVDWQSHFHLRSTWTVSALFLTFQAHEGCLSKTRIKRGDGDRFQPLTHTGGGSLAVSGALLELDNLECICACSKISSSPFPSYPQLMMSL